MTPFQEAVAFVVRSIPPGKVMSYGQVAAYVGTPRAARQVGWALHSIGEQSGLPWWRVLNNAGKVTIKENWHNTPFTQQKHLEDEGVEFSSDLTLDIERYRYRTAADTLQSYKLDADYIASVLAKYDMR